MDNNYDKEKIGKRIEYERIAKGVSQEKLAESIFISSRQAISRWEKGKTLPSLDDMLKLCNFFECELGYLLCEYDTKQRITTDISKKTGLTPKSVDNLLNMLSEQQKKPIDSFDTTPARNKILLDTLNFILENVNKSSSSLLELLANYLFSSFTHFYDDDLIENEDLYRDSGELGLWDKRLGLELPFDSNTFSNSILMSIQSKLVESRSKIQSQHESFKRLTPYDSDTTYYNEYMNFLVSLYKQDKENPYLKEQLPPYSLHDIEEYIKNTNL